MPWFRIYVDKKNGAEHSRVFDVECEDEEQAVDKLKLGKGETVNQVVSLAGDPR
jgi:hypothetical protein